MIYKLFIRTNLIWGLLPEGDAVPPDDLLLADEGVIAGDLKKSYRKQFENLYFEESQKFHNQVLTKSKDTKIDSFKRGSITFLN